jgi:hypothetical protein
MMKNFTNHIWYLLMFSLLVLFTTSCQEECKDCEPLHPFLEYDELPVITVSSRTPLIQYGDSSFQNFYLSDTLLFDVNIEAQGLEVDSVVIFAHNSYSNILTLDTLVGFLNPLNPTFSITLKPEQLQKLKIEDKSDFALRFDLKISYKNGKNNERSEVQKDIDKVYLNDLRYKSFAHQDNFGENVKGTIDGAYGFPILSPVVYDEMILYNIGGPKASVINFFGEDELLERPVDRWGDYLSLPGLFNQYHDHFFNSFTFKEFIPSIQSGVNGSNNYEYDFTKFLKIDAAYASLPPRRLIEHYYRNKENAVHVADSVKPGDIYLLYFYTPENPYFRYKHKTPGHHALMEILYVSDDGFTAEQGGSDEDFIRLKMTLLR